MEPATHVDDTEDDHLTEEDALKQAADQGIYFVDHFRIVDIATMQPVNDVKYDSQEDAERVAFTEMKLIKETHTIQQIREPAPSTQN